MLRDSYFWGTYQELIGFCLSLWGILGYTLSILKIASGLTETLLLEKGATVVLRLNMMEREENRWLQKTSTNNLHSTGSKN